MMPNHPRFIEAINQKKKVSVRFYSKADTGLLDRVCAPMDYGPGGEIQDGLNRYWLWDYASRAIPSERTEPHPSLIKDENYSMRTLA